MSDASRAAILARMSMEPDDYPPPPANEDDVLDDESQLLLEALAEADKSLAGSEDE